MTEANITQQRFFIYMRKSSESCERQAISIDSQRTEIRNRRIEALGLNVVAKPFIEERSAKRPGRPVFNDMMKRVAAGEANGILCWKLDRLSRNPIDNGMLIWELGREGNLTSVVTVDRVYGGSGDDRFMSALILAMGTKYIDDLSDNVRTKNREYLRQGFWTGKPPLGYIRDPRYKDDRRHRELLPDGKRFDDVRNMWRLILDGTRPSEVLKLANDRWHFQTKRYKRVGGGSLSKTHFYRMLRSKFYAGIMVRAGESYIGKHKPMVTLDEFQAVQSVLDDKGRPRNHRPDLIFPYRGLLSCGSCGAKVTAKRTTNRHGKTYTYYHCCRKNYRKDHCDELAIQEQDLDLQFANYFRDTVPPKNWLAAAERRLDALEKAGHRATREADNRRRLDLDRIERSLNRLRRLLVEDVLSTKDYQAEHTSLVKEKIRLERTANATESERLLKPFQDAVSLLRRAPELLATASPKQKAAVVRQLVCNPTLKGKTLLIEGQFPMGWLTHWSSCSDLCAWQNWLETLNIDDLGI